MACYKLLLSLYFLHNLALSTTLRLGIDDSRKLWYAVPLSIL